MVVKQRWLLLVVAGLVAGLAQPSQAQVAIGKVNVRKVLNDSEYVKAQFAAVQALSDKLADEDRFRRTRCPLLLDEEFDKLMALRNKAAVTPDEQKEIDRLMRLSNDRDQRLATLEAIPDAQITPAQKDERQALANSKVQSAEAIKKGTEKYAQAVDDENKKRTGVIMDQLAKAGEALAKDLNLTYILDSDVVVFGGQDVTDQFIAKLNEIAPK